MNDRQVAAAKTDINHGFASTAPLPLRVRGRVTTATRRSSKREQLLAAARDAFAQHGFHGTQLTAITMRAGIRKSTFFHYFADKASLYEEAVTGRLHKLSDEVLRAGELPLGDASRLESMIARFWQQLCDETPLAKLVLRDITDAPQLEGVGEPLQRLIGVFCNVMHCDDAPARALRIVTMLCVHRVDPSGDHGIASSNARVDEERARALLLAALSLADAR